ncbi:MAG: class I SAM-dependent rRNA methyltransferase [Alphaproteobacteria bacterium]|nr:class I SAM-dependent rRNA methyltransferase [Alphaproteobacteria bacterium]
MATIAQEAAATIRPIIRLSVGHSKRVRQGHPWVYSNEIDMNEATKRLAPGTVATLIDAGDERLGVVTFNPHSLLAARILSRDPNAEIDTAFIEARLNAALALRSALFDTPHYRLIHAEADGLPGLIIDRLGDVFVVQLNSAGMETLRDEITAALNTLFKPRAVVLRRDGTVRTLEGLARAEPELIGALDGPVETIEGDVRFLADPLHGQKTGWYFDQRDNRDFASRLAPGRRVLDAYCHTGGFALRAAASGASAVIGLDSSEPALALARQAAAVNGLETLTTFEHGDAFGALAAQGVAGERYGLVIADPPSFVKSKKEIAPGLRAYRKLTRLSAALVEPGGFLVIASCSHHVETMAFLAEVHAGLRDAGREGRLLRLAGAGADHPSHTALPESAYLKCAALALD